MRVLPCISGLVLSCGIAAPVYSQDEGNISAQFLEILALNEAIHQMAYHGSQFDPRDYVEGDQLPDKNQLVLLNRIMNQVGRVTKENWGPNARLTLVRQLNDEDKRLVVDFTATEAGEQALRKLVWTILVLSDEADQIAGIELEKRRAEIVGIMTGDIVAPTEEE